MNPRNIYKIAKWETAQSAPAISIRNVLIIFVLLSVLAGAGGLASTQNVAPSDDIYVVGVDEENEYYQPVDAAPEFSIVEPDRNAFDDGDIDILIEPTGDGETTVYVSNTDKGEAALAQLQQVVGLWNDEQLQQEPNQSAAFPLSVNIQYVDQSIGDASDIETDMNGDDADADDESEDESGSLMDSLFPSLDGVQDATSPTEISPPFPFQSVIFALLFLLPLNFIAQAYASNIMKERINNRGELLLVSPVSPGDIVLGKTLPYFIVMVLTVAFLSVITGGGVMGVIAMLPIIITFLSAVFIAALIARSYKELTFITVTISVGLIAYAFIPAIFTGIHAIAFVSPLTLVVMSIDGTSVSLVEFLFATIPLTLTGLLLFVYGIGLYNEENLFTQKPIHEKFLDGITIWTPNLLAVPLITAAFLPFVFAAQLIVLASLFPLPPDAALIMLFFMIAVIEEIAKSIHIYAGFKNKIFDNSLRTALIAGALSGFGFYIAENATVITQYVGLREMEIGQAAFGADLTGTTPLMLVVSLLLPLVLHMITAMLSSIGARQGLKKYLLWMGLAITIHMAYNLTIIMAFVL